jgi:acetyl-CoA acetyltransferase
LVKPNNRRRKMAAKREVVVLSAARSAIGAFGGSLKDVEPADLGGMVIKEAIARVATIQRVTGYRIQA